MTIARSTRTTFVVQQINVLREQALHLIILFETLEKLIKWDEGTI